MLNNGCNDFSFCVHCVEEGDRIPPLQSYGQALKQKDCFSDVLGDDCDASYYYYYYYYYYSLPRACPGIFIWAKIEGPKAARAGVGFLKRGSNPSPPVTGFEVL